MSFFSDVADFVKPVTDLVTPGLSSAFGALTAYQGGQSTNQANIDIANANNQWSAQQYATRYQTQVKDLEAAGLNPMLAYLQSPGSAPTAQPVQVQNSAGEAVRAYNEGYSSRTRGEHDIASAGAARKMQDQIEATTEKIREEIPNVKKEGFRLDGFVAKLEAERQNLVKLGLNLTEQGNVLRQTLTNLQKDGNLKELETTLKMNQVEAEKMFDNFGREYKQLSPVLQLLKGILLGGR